MTVINPVGGNIDKALKSKDYRLGELLQMRSVIKDVPESRRPDIPQIMAVGEKAASEKGKTLDCKQILSFLQNKTVEIPCGNRKEWEKRYFSIKTCF